MRPVVAVAFALSLLAACAASDRYPLTDERGRSAAADPDGCFAGLSARRYVHEMREKLFEAWEPPPGHHGIARIVCVIRLGPSGELEQLYVEEPHDAVAESAIAAFHRAAPFGPLPTDAVCLAEESFRAEFRLLTR